jgi:hypothetical protein
MSENKAVARRFVELLGRGDSEGLRKPIATDLAAISTGASMVSGGRGHADIQAGAAMRKAITDG